MYVFLHVVLKINAEARALSYFVIFFQTPTSMTQGKNRRFQRLMIETSWKTLLALRADA